MTTQKARTFIWHKVTSEGLWDRINQEVLEPLLGITVYEYPEEGYIADNGVWEYSQELTERLLNSEEVIENVQKLLTAEGYIENTNSK